MKKIIHKIEYYENYSVSFVSIVMWIFVLAFVNGIFGFIAYSTYPENVFVFAFLFWISVYVTHDIYKRGFFDPIKENRVVHEIIEGNKK